MQENKMFWGLLLKANKRYSQVVQKSFRVSQATLDIKAGDLGDEVTQVWITSDDSSHLLCNLDQKTSQCTLDLQFLEGETVVLFSKGSGVVHLTGYMLPEDPGFEYDGMGEEELGDEEEEDESVSDDEAGTSKQAKKAKASQDDDDEDSSELDENELLSDDEELEEEEAGEEEENEGSDDDDENDIALPAAKKAKTDKPAQVQNGLENGNAAKKPDGKKKDKKEKKPQPNSSQPNASTSQQNAKAPKSAARQVAGGVTIEDLRPGKGPEAKTGRRVSVYYEGRLKSNNKVFDSTKAGDGFKFSLGRGEVIKGWDAGVLGMKVGGKRRITCPPHAAYGARGSPPTIPPNATLVFDVELRGVN